MSRNKRSVTGRGPVWFMDCDQDCGTSVECGEDLASAPLRRFFEAGWFIAQVYGDCCPSCRKAGKAIGIPPMPKDVLYYRPIERTYGMDQRQFSDPVRSI